MNKNNKIITYVLMLAGGAGILTLLDQWTKYLAVTHLKGQADIPLIPGVLQLHYLENTGAAFGILRDKQWVFYIITILLLAVIAFMYFKMPKTGRYMPAHLVCIFIIAGAIGNFIDRIRLKYVIDFIYFSLIDFPVFNVADIYVVVGTILMAILILFVYKDEDFAFLKKKES